MRSGATRRGPTAARRPFEPGSIVLPPSLRVLLQPPEAVAAGAGWMIESGLWRNSGDNVQGLAPGDHTVVYKPPSGGPEPGSETVTLTNGLATTITRLYLQDAAIRIGLQPADAVAGRRRLAGR